VSRFDEQAEDLFENAPCGYLSAAPDGTLLRVNATFLEWTGYRREELVGVKRFQDLLSVGGRIYHETHYAPMLRLQGSVREIAVDIVGANGDRLSVLVNSVLVRDAEGAPELVRTTVFDATERKLYERELLAARDRERAARERIERLQRITAALAVAPDTQAIAAVVIEELTAAFHPAGIAVAVRDPAGHELEVVARRGVVAADAIDESRPEYDEGGVAAVPFPLGVAGRLWIGFDGPRAWARDERDFLGACAAQIGLALERARLHQRTADVAVALQRSLLAGDPPADPRFTVATLSRPAVEDLEVGGDWHDAFRLPAGGIGIVVGDVVGRGLLAATAMGQLRSAVRALAGAGLEPAAVLAHLDTFVEQVATARYATLAYAEVDPDTGEVTFASAGHLPPVILGGEPHLYMEGRSAPLGVTAPSMPRPDATFTLPPGGGFLLYTDGLVERRGEPIDAGLARLLAAIRSTSPQDLVRTLPDSLAEQGAPDDDVCLLSFHRSEAGA
jgi:PAS domain S-box-containing protein